MLYRLSIGELNSDESVFALTTEWHIDEMKKLEVLLVNCMDAQRRNSLIETAVITCTNNENGDIAFEERCYCDANS